MTVPDDDVLEKSVAVEVLIAVAELSATTLLDVVMVVVDVSVVFVGARASSGVEPLSCSSSKRPCERWTSCRTHAHLSLRSRKCTAPVYCVEHN